MKHYVLSTLLLAVSTTSTFSQPTAKSEYLVIRDNTTKICTVAETRPVKIPKNTSVVDDRITYPTKADAETGMKTMKLCMR